RYLPYPLAFWALVGCTLAMIAWLIAAGCTVLGAAVMVLVLELLFFVVTRVVAETGLVHIELSVPLYKPWQLLSQAGWHDPVPVKTFYFNALLEGVHFSFREAMPVYASHAVKLADETLFSGDSLAADGARQRSTGRKFILLLAAALAVGYAVSWASTLWTEYRYSSTKDVTAVTPINRWGADYEPKMLILDPTMEYKSGIYSAQDGPLKNWVFGFGLTALLGFLRLRYAWWPLHPIGYLMLFTFPTAMFWFSIFIGWVLKVLIVRFGGPTMYVRSKPFFLGVIVGESAAAGFWLIAGILLSSAGAAYHGINFMPG
ncbi:MAG TPA: DUF6785 family protein, partial [Tepidisphaeraceae bacterium]